MWAEKTGIAMPDAQTLLVARALLEKYALITKREMPVVVDEALAKFEELSASWTMPQGLTPSLFIRKWEAIQAAMGKKVPRSKAPLGSRPPAIEPVRRKSPDARDVIAALSLGEDDAKALWSKP